MTILYSSDMWIFLSLQLYAPEDHPERPEHRKTFQGEIPGMCYVFFIIYVYQNVIYKLLDLLLEKEFHKFWIFSISYDKQTIHPQFRLANSGWLIQVRPIQVNPNSGHEGPIQVSPNSG